MKVQSKKARKQTGPGERHTSALQVVHQAEFLRRAGDNLRAEKLYRRAIGADPLCTDAWADLGCLMMDSRRYSEAVDCFRKVLDVETEASGGCDEALQQLEKIAAARTGWARGQFSLACAREQLAEYESARGYLATVLRLDPSLEVAVQSLLGSMFRNEERLMDALACVDRALAIDPGYFYAHVIRGRCCSALGRMHEACESFRRAVEINPHPEPHSSLLFQMNCLAETTPETLYAEACRWNSMYAAPLAKQIRPHTNTPDAERRLRVGYVSPDLYNHAVMKFVPPVLEHHDRSRVEAFVYAVGSKSDGVTERLRGGLENYAVIQGPYSELADRVRADGIDILVDLAGHTMGPAYLAFALKPAPIQVSWIGALSTTGLSTMDYFLGDAQMPCPGTEHLFTETVYRLPGSVCCYRPFENIPVAPAPCLERGYLTFGCLNSQRKITREVVKLWSTILHLVPKSRMLMKYQGMETDAVQGKLRGWFLEDGIPGERLLFEGSDRATEYLMAYGGIDIALDPFPYNGGSTTLDTLWMGVPVVTLAGRLAVQSCGASLLSAVGLNDLIAHTPEEYVKAALFLADTVPKMRELRCNVRQALLSSPLMDEIGHVRIVEEAYRDMWRAWCRARS